MKRYYPIALALVAVALVGYAVLRMDSPLSKPIVSNAGPSSKTANILASFGKMQRCARSPRFLAQMGVAQPVMIDLSQKRYTGIALLYGSRFTKVLHPKRWERYGHFSTYALDEQGNVYLVPTPFISIRSTTFSLQKKLFRLNTLTGKLSVFFDFDDVHPSERNPYGVNAIAYDCNDHTLWVGAIDESDYATQKGVIYHLDPHTRTILSRYEGFDALTLMRIDTSKGSFVLAGSARDNGLYAFAIDTNSQLGSPVRLLSIPSATERIRKIKSVGPNRLELQTIPFSYSLIAQTAENDRIYYDAQWYPDKQRWLLRKKSPKKLPFSPQ